MSSKIEKTKSGKWHTKVFLYKNEDGKCIYKSITADTKIECEILAADAKKNRNTTPKTAEIRTVGNAVDKYINMVRATLSPTTIQCYESIRKTAFADLMDTPVDKLNNDVINYAIACESKRTNDRTGKTISSKAVKNSWGLISAALKTECQVVFYPKLPKIQHKVQTLPEPSDVIKAIKGTPIELPCMLAMWLSFSMSEIKGLMCSSIHGNIIQIDQVMVKVNNANVIKSDAKTGTRKRKARIPAYIMDLIKNTDTYKDYLETGEDQPLISATQRSISARYKRIMDKAGLSISFHGLRHLFASVCLTKLQLPEKITQDKGGWSTPYVMESVYSNSFSADRVQADDLIDDYFGKIVAET